MGSVPSSPILRLKPKSELREISRTIRRNSLSLPSVHAVPQLESTPDSGNHCGSPHVLEVQNPRLFYDEQTVVSASASTRKGIRNPNNTNISRQRTDNGLRICSAAETSTIPNHPGSLGKRANSGIRIRPSEKPPSVPERHETLQSLFMPIPSTLSCQSQSSSGTPQGEATAERAFQNHPLLRYRYGSYPLVTTPTPRSCTVPRRRD